MNVDVNQGEMVTHAIYQKSTFLFPADGISQCSLAHVNLQPTNAKELIGCQMNISEHLGRPTWQLIVNAPEQGSVECGVVCSCPVSSNSAVKWPCIQPKGRSQSVQEDLNTNHSYSSWSVTMIGVFVVLCLAFSVLMYTRVDKRKR